MFFLPIYCDFLIQNLIRVASVGHSILHNHLSINKIIYFHLSAEQSDDTSLVYQNGGNQNIWNACIKNKLTAFFKFRISFIMLLIWLIWFVLLQVPKQLISILIIKILINVLVFIYYKSIVGKVYIKKV